MRWIPLVPLSTIACQVCQQSQSESETDQLRADMSKQSRKLSIFNLIPVAASRAHKSSRRFSVLPIVWYMWLCRQSFQMTNLAQAIMEILMPLITARSGCADSSNSTRTSFTKKVRQSASGAGRKSLGICHEATTIVAHKSVGSWTTNGQMKASSKGAAAIHTFYWTYQCFIINCSGTWYPRSTPQPRSGTHLYVNTK